MGKRLGEVGGSVSEALPSRRTGRRGPLVGEAGEKAGHRRPPSQEPQQAQIAPSLEPGPRSSQKAKRAPGEKALGEAG